MCIIGKEKEVLFLFKLRTPLYDYDDDDDHCYYHLMLSNVQLCCCLLL